jgi:cytochrome c oxidase assembly factor CtaG
VVITRLHASIRGRNMLLNIFEMWVALAGVISGLVFFYSPASIDNNALSQTIGHDFSAVWNVSYFVAGLIIWYGLLRPSPKWEVVGLYILGGATAINGLAICSIFGLRGVPTAATLIALAVASWLRASFVFRTALRLVEESHAPSG